MMLHMHPCLVYLGIFVVLNFLPTCCQFSGVYNWSGSSRPGTTSTGHGVKISRGFAGILISEARAALRCVSESFDSVFLTSDSFDLFDITPAPAEEISAQRWWQGRSMTLIF